MSTALTSAAHPVEELLRMPPFSLCREEKEELFAHALSRMTESHFERCPNYRRALQVFDYKPEGVKSVKDLPFLPVRLFKEFDLLSVERQEVFKTITSSGTTGQAVSKIYLDRATAANQTKTLVKIVSDFCGPQRLPFLIVDSPAVVKDRTLFSARGAGILGFGMIGRDPTYLLDEEYRIDFERLEEFCKKHVDDQVLLFGFTFIVWERLCQALRDAGKQLRLNGVLIHGGGWKKLASLAVDDATFQKTVRETCGIDRVYNYYGMAEQTGSIFMQCEKGVLHASNFSDILVRDPLTFAALEAGRTGLLQLVSLLPESYPGHSILTEDLGEILGVDDCPCGRKGVYFKVHGRVKNAEIRGCSDVFASRS